MGLEIGRRLRKHSNETLSLECYGQYALLDVILNEPRESNAYSSPIGI
jgi:hypothetical protein